MSLEIRSLPSERVGRDFARSASEASLIVKSLPILRENNSYELKFERGSAARCRNMAREESSLATDAASEGT